MSQENVEVVREVYRADQLTDDGLIVHVKVHRDRAEARKAAGLEG